MSYCKEEILDILKAKANPHNVKGMARFGMTSDKRLGISVPDMRKIAKEVGRDHELALDLWRTGIPEARILASMIGEPDKMTDEQMEDWAKGINSSDFSLECMWGLGESRSDMGAYGAGDSVMTPIDEFPMETPNEFALLQNYPNPFNPSTTINYSLPEQADVRIEIYNILGQKVATLFDGDQQAGQHEIVWRADEYPSGVYFARMSSAIGSKNIKMLLLK